MIDKDAIAYFADAVAAKAPPIKCDDGSLVVVVPEGYTFETIEAIDPPLLRIKQAVTMHDRDGFVSYVNRFKSDQQTRIFAEPGFLAGGAAYVHAALDYHAPGEAAHRVHNARYVLRYSDQWMRWQRVCSQPMRQAEFAEFVEENRNDIKKPDAAQLLDIVRMFKASKKTEFDSVVYQPNGDVTLTYDEKTAQQGKSGVLPEKMTIGIPVYFRGTVYAVDVFVRYKVGGGAVQFSLKLDRPDVIEDAAFGEVAKAIAEATGVEVYLGKAA